LVLEEPQVTTFDRVKKVIVEQLAGSERPVTTASSLVQDLGLKWLDPVELILALEEEFGIAIPAEAFEEFHTVADLVAYIDATTRARMSFAPKDNLTDLLRIEFHAAAAFEEEDAWSRGEDLLLYLPAAAPCRTAWQEMEGDDLVRLCRRCGKNVYNLAGMSGWEARDFVREAEARRGVRFYRRRDGTLIADDCPRGRQAKQVARVWARVFICLVIAVLGWLGGFWIAW